MNFIISNKYLKRTKLLVYIFLFVIPVLLAFILFPKPTASGIVYYLFFLLTFSVTAIITYYSLNEFVSSIYVCLLFSITYSCMSWHFLKYNQFFLGFYGFLPYTTTCMIRFTLDLDVPDFKKILILLIVEVFLIIFQPMWGIVVFTISVVFTLYRIINRKKLNKWYILITVLPALSFITNGFDAEPYTGIKLVELFIPLENSYIDVFSKIYSYFDTHLIQYEVFHIKLYNYAHLGIVLSISLIWAIIDFLFLKEKDDLVDFCNIMIVTLLFIFLFWGITVILYYGDRAVNYESFIMVIAFFLCITGGKFLEKIQVSVNKLLFYGLTGILFLISIISCVPTTI